MFLCFKQVLLLFLIINTFAYLDANATFELELERMNSNHLQVYFLTVLGINPKTVNIMISRNHTFPQISYLACNLVNQTYIIDELEDQGSMTFQTPKIVGRKGYIVDFYYNICKNGDRKFGCFTLILNYTHLSFVINSTNNIYFLNISIIQNETLNYQGYASSIILPSLNFFRIEEYHISSYIITLLIYILLFILLILFRNKQPLKSRSLLPYLSVLSQFFMFIPGFFNYIPRDMSLPIYFYSDIFYTIIYLYFRFSTISVLLFLSILLFYRYIILLNLNLKKMIFIKNTQTENYELKWHWIVLKHFGDMKIQILLFIFSYILFSLYQSFAWLHYLGPNVFMNFYFYSIIILMAFLGFLGFIFDIITNLNLIKKCKFYKLWKDDIFLFRFEIYFLFLFIIFPLSVVFYIIIDTNFDYIYYYNDRLIKKHNGVFHIFNSIIMFSLLFWQVIFVLGVTIFNFLKQIFIKKEESEMKFCLEHERGYQLFLKQTKQGKNIYFNII